VRYNLVVIGKAGVGKTQLINYLLGQDLLSTGIGTPVTGLGYHRTDLILTGVPATIWDSAGLEVGRHEEWIKALKSVLKDRGPTQPVEKWFHTVLYCVQGPGNRIEQYEIDIINNFLKEKYKVIIVVTKAFVGQDELDELAKSIRKNVAESISLVFVNSRDKEIAGGIIIPSSGKGELKREIQISLIESLTHLIPLRCITFMEEHLDEERNKLVNYIEQVDYFEPRKAIGNHVELVLRKTFNEIVSPRGLFHHIVIRETRQTLTVYKEIASLVEYVMELAESQTIVCNANVSSSLPTTPTFWMRFMQKINELDDFSWDLETSWAEIVDTSTKVIVASFAAL
jgi:GTPase SAR1 family protein